MMNDQIMCAIADRVYTDLQQDKRITNIERIHDVDKIYFRTERDDIPVIILPILNTQHLNLLQLEELQTKLTTDELKNIILAICDTSSNVLYYQITSGFVEQKSQST